MAMRAFTRWLLTPNGVVSVVRNGLWPLRGAFGAAFQYRAFLFNVMDMETLHGH